MRPPQPVAVFLCLAVVCLPAEAEHFAAVATTSGAQYATVRGVLLSRGSTIYSGELLTTGDSGYLRLQAGKIQFHAGANSSLRLFRSGEKTVVELQTGSLTYSQNAPGNRLTIYAGDIRFAPNENEERNFGQITLLSNCVALARVSQGTLEIGTATEKFVVRTGQSHLTTVKTGVEYTNTAAPRDDRALPDIATPEFHLNHLHVACDENPPKPSVEFGSGTKIRVAIVGGVAIVALIEALESPDGP